MWSDKCEWMHGFTRFGAWHPNQIFRSKSVGKRKTINTYYIYGLQLTTDIVYLNEDHELKIKTKISDDQLQSLLVVYLVLFTRKFYVMFMVSYVTVQSLLFLLITIQNTKNTSMHSRNHFFVAIYTNKPCIFYTESLVKRLLKLLPRIEASG